MELEIMKNAFLEIDKISALKSHMDKLVGKKIDGYKAIGNLEIDISYRDMNGNECFKSLPFEFKLDLDELNIKDIKLKSTNVYVVEGRGISIDYVLNISCESDDTKEVEIIEIDNKEDYIESNSKIEGIEEQEIKLEEIVYGSLDENVEDDSNPQLEEKVDNNATAQLEKNINSTNPLEDMEKLEEIEKIKEDISKDYENKLADNLNQRDNKIAIVSTKGCESELNFLRFFDDTVSTYYSIKTLYCSSEEMLNSIAKEYKIPMDILLKGYDKQNGKVTFKLNR